MKELKSAETVLTLTVQDINVWYRELNLAAHYADALWELN